MLPKIKETRKSRTYIEQFRGYNHRARIAENELYDCYNVSNDDYPVLSTRAARGDCGNLFSSALNISAVYGILGGDRLSAVVNADGAKRLYYDGNLYDIGLEASEVPRRLLRMGARIIVLPDYCVFDTVNLSGAKKESFEVTVDSFSIQMCSVSESGELAEINLRAGPLEESTQLDERYFYWEKEEGNPTALVDCSGGGTRLLRGEDIYLKISVKDEGFLYLFKESAKTENKEKYNFRIQIPGFSEGNDYELNAENCLLFEKDGYILVSGCLPRYHAIRAEKGEKTYYTVYSTEKELQTSRAGAHIKLDVPMAKCDYIVECQNRLWGCRHGENVVGDTVNEIYCTALGTYDEWHRYDGLADSSWSASVGSPGEFTGAIALGGTPIFFKENIAYKVYPSSSGAHQVVTLDIRGIEAGSEKSIVYFNESVIYKGRDYFFYFDGSSVRPISDALGRVHYKNAVAGADGDKYVVYCEDDAGEKHIFAYDTRLGLWQRELTDENIIEMTAHDGRLLMLKANFELNAHTAREGDTLENNIRYMFESGEIGFSSPDSKYLLRLDMRVKLDFGATFNVWVQYDGDGKYYNAVRLRGMNPVPKSETLYVMPRRCDHFKIKVSGTGNFKLYSISRIYEEHER